MRAAARPVESCVFHPPEIAVSLSGLPSGGPGAALPWGVTTADACRWVRDLPAPRGRGVRGVALDASRGDLRARELGRSARRDIGAMLRRSELELSSIDLWIPPAHFEDPTKSARAIETATQTAQLVGELARLAGGRSAPVVSVTLPPTLDASVRAELGASAERYGSLIADHTPGVIVHAGVGGGGLGVGVDPALCLMAGESPGKRAVAGGADRLALRLSDADANGRCAVGAPGGRLDLAGYAGACLTATNTSGIGGRWMTLDLRGVSDPARAARAGIEAWIVVTTPGA